MKIIEKVTGIEYELNKAIHYLLTPSAGSKRKELVANYLADLTQILIDKSVLSVDDVKELLRVDFNVEED